MKVTRSAVVGAGLSALLGSTSPAVAQGTAVGTWNDLTTSGIGQTKIVESSCVTTGGNYICSLSALAEQRASNPPRQGTCTDTTVTVSGQSFAGPCRASFGGRVVMQRTGSPPACNGAEFLDGTEPEFQYANTLGVNRTLRNISINVVNNRVTVNADVVDVDGTRVQEMKGTFLIQCRNNTHYGSWSGTFRYVF